MNPRSTTVVIKGAGEMASGVAAILFQAGFCRLLMLEIARPLAVRRQVSFCEAVAEGRASVEDIEARLAASADEVVAAWSDGVIAVAADPEWSLIAQLRPQVVIDAILAKRNLGTCRSDAPLVIGLGPGFTAGEDVHYVIETQRGHHLGRVYALGAAQANTGVPGLIGGYTVERVLRAPCAGAVTTCHKIGDSITAGDTVMMVAGQPVRAQISGVLRGCIRSGAEVPAGCKLGDIDPRADLSYCSSISEKARMLGLSALFTVVREGAGNSLRDRED